MRVLASSKLAEALEAEPQVVESTFEAWWNLRAEDARAASLQDAPEGTFWSEWNDPSFAGADESGYVKALCSRETGEPEVASEEPTPEGEAPVEPETTV